MRIIAHLDLDAFFAAVAELDHPWLAGRPVVIGADPKAGLGRGVVSTANYKAREYGIHSAMPISKAWQLSEIARKAGKEPAMFLGADFSRYSEISERVMDIIRRRVPLTEQGGIDEMYLDLSFTGSYEAARVLAAELKNEIKASEKLTISAGIGPNKLIAKIASDRQKPNGLTVVSESDAEKFLEPLAARVIPGIGPKTEAALADDGVKSIADLKKISREDLVERFGKWGSELYDKARGRDDSPVEESDEIKSIGEQETFERDTLDLPFVAERLNTLAAGVHAQFVRGGFKGFRTVTLTARFADFETKSRAHTLKTQTASADILRFEAMKLLFPFFDKRENPHQKKIRLIGVRVEKLS